MVITYEGVEFIKITHGDTTIACNPISKESKFKGSNFGADVALITTNHPDMNGVESVTRNNKEPFVVSGPGEYEVDGFFIRGFASKTTYGEVERINTIYTFELDSIRVGFLGALGDGELSGEIKEMMGSIDVLFVPIGGQGVLDSAEAYKLAVKREASIIIPIHFGSVGDKGALKQFLEEGSSEDTKPIDKLTIKRRDVEGKKGEIVVLKAQN